MFLKFTQSKGRRYVQLVEAFRDETGHPRQRTVATLGRLDEDGGTIDAMLSRLAQAKGRKLDGAAGAAPQVQFESALALGDVWALDQLCASSASRNWPRCFAGRVSRRRWRARSAPWCSTGCATPTPSSACCAG